MLLIPAMHIRSMALGKLALVLIFKNPATCLTPNSFYRLFNEIYLQKRLTLTALTETRDWIRGFLKMRNHVFFDFIDGWRKIKPVLRRNKSRFLFLM